MRRRSSSPPCCASPNATASCTGPCAAACRSRPRSLAVDAVADQVEAVRAEGEAVLAGDASQLALQILLRLRGKHDVLHHAPTAADHVVSVAPEVLAHLLAPPIV